MGSGAKAVAGGAKAVAGGAKAVAVASPVGRGLLVSTVHAGTAGAVRPPPVRGREGWRLVPRSAEKVVSSPDDRVSSDRVDTGPRSGTLRP